MSRSIYTIGLQVLILSAAIINHIVLQFTRVINTQKQHPFLQQVYLDEAPFVLL